MTTRYNSRTALLEAVDGALVLFEDYAKLEADNTSIRRSLADAATLATDQAAELGALRARNAELVKELEVLTAAAGPAISENAALKREIEIACTALASAEAEIRELRLA